MDTVLVRQQGPIKVITYNKPKRKNAIDIDMYVKVTQILNDTADDTETTLLVITGTGDYYSSGNDLVASLERPNTNLENALVVFKEFVNAFIKFPKLLVAIVNGPAVGIAATTLPLFDMVFASHNAFFYTPFTKLGLVPEGCSSYTFPRLVGDRKATELLLLNYRMTAQEALDWGFVNYLYKPEDLHSVWDKIVEYSKLSTKSLQIAKRLMKNTVKDVLLEVNNTESDELSKVWTSEEYINNLISFMNKKNKL